MFDLRQAKHLSQQKLAIDIGIDQTSISNYETGKTFPQLEALAAYAKYFGVSMDYLLGLTDVKVPIKTPADDQTAYAAGLFASLPASARARAIGYMERLKEENAK